MLVMTNLLSAGSAFVSWAAGSVYAIKRSTNGKRTVVVSLQYRNNLLFASGISSSIGLI
jgi:hypothetical protein